MKDMKADWKDMKDYYIISFEIQKLVLNQKTTVQAI